MSIDRAELLTAAHDCLVAAGKFEEGLKALPPGDFEVKDVRSLFSKFKLPYTALARLVDQDADHATFQEFFRSVGASMVRAQEDLDEASGDYLAKNPPGGAVLPSVFRIPRVTAEARFALEKVREGGFDLLFFKDVKSRRESHQQSVSFEIAAVPPPPELIAELRRNLPTIDLVLDPVLRRRLFAALAESDADAAVKELLKGAGTSLLIWPAPAEAAWFLLLAKASAVRLLGIWHLAAGDTPKVTAVYAYDVPPRDSDKLNLLWRAVLETQKKQAAYFDSLRPEKPE